MPVKDIKYENTIIYIIQHTTKLDLIYVGHTTNFGKRKCEHKRATMTGKNVKIYTMIRENGGWDEFEMRPIKKISCNDSVEARIEEEKCRIEYHATLNMIRAVKDEESQKAYFKKYKEEHHQEIRDKWKEYYQGKKEHFKEYRDGRKAEAKEYKKEYYEKNKEEINKERYKVCICSCGKEYTYCNKGRHEKTKYHIENSV